MNPSCEPKPNTTPDLPSASGVPVPARVQAWPSATLVLEQTAQASSPYVLRECSLLSWPAGLSLSADPEPMDLLASDKRSDPSEMPHFWTSARWKEEGDPLGFVDRPGVLFISKDHRTLSVLGEPRRQEADFCPVPHLVATSIAVRTVAAHLALRDLASFDPRRFDRGLAWLALLVHTPRNNGLWETFWPTAVGHVLAKTHLIARDWQTALSAPAWAPTPMEPVRAWALEAELGDTLPSAPSSAATPRLRL